MVLLFASNCRQARFSGGQGPGLLETRGRADLCQRRRARQRFASVLADPPGGQNRSAPPGPAAAARRRHRRTDRQMAGSERSRLQKSSHSAHSRSVIPLAAARDRSRLFVGECVLDGAPRQASCGKLDRQPFERPACAPRKRSPQVRDEGLRRIANLRRRILHRAFRRLHFARPITVAVARLLALACVRSARSQLGSRYIMNS